LQGHGRIQQLQSGGPLLSLLDEASYSSGEVMLTHGDLLLLYTDGVVETMTGEGEEFGLRRLQKVLVKTSTSPAAATIDAIIQATQQFSGTANYLDDYTLMLIKRL